VLSPGGKNLRVCTSNRQWARVSRGSVSLVFALVKVEQLGARDVVDPGIEPVAIEPRQRLPDECVGDAALLEDDRPVTFPPRAPQAVDTVHGIRRGRQVEGRAVEDDLVRTRHERGDDRRPPGEGGGQERPDLLRVPRGERDGGSPREILLEELKMMSASSRSGRARS
jgi:hypothetical protein